MQPPFSCVPTTFAEIEKALSPPRLGRYLTAAAGDKHYALRLYFWNARLAEAFYVPSQICEVSVRNAIHLAVRTHYGDAWYKSLAFAKTLPDRLQGQLTKVIQDEAQAYGTAVTVDHLVSGLTFGFWVHLLTPKYSHALWPRFHKRCFPNKPAAVDGAAILGEVERFRVQRNRIAHHKPLFDRGPVAEYQRMLKVIDWISHETHWLVQTTARVQQTINDRPFC